MTQHEYVACFQESIYSSFQNAWIIIDLWRLERDAWQV